MEVHKPYMKYEVRWKKHGIIKLATYFIVFLILILLIFLPVFRVDFTKMSEERAQTVLFAPSTLPKLHDIAKNGNWLWDESALSFNFSIFDETYAGHNPILSAFSESGATGGNGENSDRLPSEDMVRTAANAAGSAGMAAIIALVIGAAGIVVMIAVTLYRTVSTENYTIHMYDKIKWRRDTESGWHKQHRSWQSWLGAAISVYVTLAMIGVFASLITSGIGYTAYTVSYFSLVTGISGWFWLLAVLALAAIVLQIIAAILKSRIRTAILHEEYDTPPVAPQTLLEEPFPELEAARQRAVAAAQQNQLPQGAAHPPYAYYYPYPNEYPQPNAAQNPQNRQAPPYGFAPAPMEPSGAVPPAAPQAAAPTPAAPAPDTQAPPKAPEDGKAAPPAASADKNKSI